MPPTMRICGSNAGASDSVRYPWAMGPPNGPSFARSGSTWIHWWSPVASAKRSIFSCGTSIQLDGPKASPACIVMSERASRLRSAALLRRFLGELFGFDHVAAGARDERRLQPLLDRLLGDHALGDVLARRQLEHHVEQSILDDRAETACARLAVEGLVGDRPEGVVGKDEVDRVVVEEALVLTG